MIARKKLKLLLLLALFLTTWFSLEAEAGSLVMVGGSLKGNNAEIYGKIVELAGGNLNARIGIITAASSNEYYAEDNGAYYVSRFAQHGAVAEWIPLYFDPLHGTIEFDPDIYGENEDFYALQNGSEEVLHQISTMTGFFFGGGDQSRLISVLMRYDWDNNCYYDSPALAAIRDKLMNHGAVVAGTSAGAVICPGGSTGDLVSQDWMIYKYIEPETGLPNATVNAVLRDSQDRVWMGTDIGLGLWENGEWINYDESNSEIISHTIYSITEAPDGKIWLGTYGGVSCFDGETWENFSTDNAPFPANKTYSVEVDALNNIWVGTTYGILMYDGTTWTVHDEGPLLDVLVRSIAAESRTDGDDWIWVGIDGYTSGNDLALAKFDLDDDIWEYFFYNDPIGDDEIKDIAVDANGIKWLGGYNGFHKYDDETFTTYDPFNKSAITVAVDSDNIPWIGFNAYGLTRFENDEFTYYDTGNSPIPGNYLNDIFIDPIDNIWMATEGDGAAVHYADETWETFSVAVPPGLPSDRINAVNSIETEEEDSFWIGTDNGAVRFNGLNWNVFEVEFLPDTLVSAIDFSREIKEGIEVISTWLGTASGLIEFYEIEDEQFWEVPTGAPDDKINIIKTGPDNIKWFGTDNGLYSLEDGSWQHFTSELPDLNVTAIAIDLDRLIWIGTDNGLASFDGVSWEYYDSSDWPLNTDMVTSLNSDLLANIWVGTDLGLMQYQNLEWFETDHPAVAVNWIDIDLNNNVFTATNDGLYKFSTNQWQLLDSANSELPSDQVNSLYIDNRSNKWIATEAGLAKLVESKIDNDVVVPMVTGGNPYKALLDGAHDNFTGDYDDLTCNPLGGFGFFPYGTLDSHTSQRGRQGRLLRLAADKGVEMMYGLDENTALVVENVATDSVRMEVLGQYRENGVTIIDISEAEIYSSYIGDEEYWAINDVKMHFLTKHDQFFPLTKEIIFADWKSQLTEIDQPPYVSEDVLSSPYIPRPVLQDPSGYQEDFIFLSTRLFESTSPSTYGHTYEQTPEYRIEMIKDPYWSPEGYSGGYGNETYWSYQNLQVNVFPEGATLVKTDIPKVPAFIKNNYPNPFNPSTQIEFSLKHAGKTEISIYNIKGQLVKTLVNDNREAGTYSVTWEGRDHVGRIVGSGIYFCAVKFNDQLSDTRKMTMIK